MSDTKIYDKLVEEFEAAGKYHGLGFVPPEMVTLSAYDDTTTIPAVKDDIVVPWLAEEPSEGTEETSDETKESEEETVEQTPTVEASKTWDVKGLLEKLSVVHGDIPETELVSPDNHVFPIRRYDGTFNFFDSSKTAPTVVETRAA